MCRRERQCINMRRRGWRLHFTADWALCATSTYVSHFVRKRLPLTRLFHTVSSVLYSTKELGIDLSALFTITGSSVTQKHRSHASLWTVSRSIDRGVLRAASKYGAPTTSCVSLHLKNKPHLAATTGTVFIVASKSKTPTQRNLSDFEYSMGSFLKGQDGNTSGYLVFGDYTELSKKAFEAKGFH